MLTIFFSNIISFIVCRWDRKQVHTSIKYIAYRSQFGDIDILTFTNYTISTLQLCTQYTMKNNNWSFTTHEFKYLPILNSFKNEPYWILGNDYFQTIDQTFSYIIIWILEHFSINSNTRFLNNLSFIT